MFWYLVSRYCWNCHTKNAHKLCMAARIILNVFNIRDLIQSLRFLMSRAGSKMFYEKLLTNQLISSTYLMVWMPFKKVWEIANSNSLTKGAKWFEKRQVMRTWSLLEHFLNDCLKRLFDNHMSKILKEGKPIYAVAGTFDLTRELSRQRTLTADLYEVVFEKPLR